MGKQALLFAFVLVLVTTACVDASDTSSSSLSAHVTPITTPASPQMLRMAYVKGGNVWLWVENGSGYPLTTTGGVTQVKISDSGEWVAYKQNGELWLVNTSGNPTSQLIVSNAYLAGLNPQGDGAGQIDGYGFTRNNQSIYLTISGNGNNGRLDLFKIDLDTKMPVRMIGPGRGGTYIISPDGECLAIYYPSLQDLFCKGDIQPRHVFEFAYECEFGAHAVPDIHWSADSSGFYTVTPICDNNILHYRQRLQYVPRSGGNPQIRFEFVGWIFDQADISPNGDCLAHLVDNGDMQDLRIGCSDRVEEIYATYPKDRIGFIGWAPDSVHFVFWKSEDDKVTEAMGRPLYADLTHMPVPLLSDISQAYDITWVDSSRFLFFSNGLYVGWTDGKKSQIDNGLSRSTIYDFSPKP